MELQSLLSLIEKVDASSLTEFQVEEGNLKISMKKQKKTFAVTTLQGVAETALSDMTTAPVQASEKKADGNEVKAPLVGTFYNAPSPDEAPFVAVGDKVKKGQTLGIIEAMKLMNEIVSEFDGTVEEILVDNETMVEYGQPLFVIR